MELGRSQAEVELTKKLARTLVQREVMEPMAAQNWGHGTPSPERTAEAVLSVAKKAEAAGAPPEQIEAYLAERGFKKITPPASGQPANSEGAPATAAVPAPKADGQPDPTKATPAPAVPAKTDAPAATPADQNVRALFESLRDATGKIMGKYLTVEDALKGAGHLANMAKQALARAEQAEARLSELAATAPAGSPAAAPAAAPASKPFSPVSRPELVEAQARLDKVLSKISEDGFDGDSAKEYAEATREVARQQALAVANEERQRAAHAADAESAKWDAVNRYMSEKYPDSVNVEDSEFRLFLSLNPLLTEAMTALRAQGREFRAAELGYTEFVKSRDGVPATPGMTRAEAERKEIELSEREQVRNEARAEALKDAGIVHGSAGGASAVETPGITGPSQDDINAMAAAMRREGDAPGSAAASQWRKAVIGRFLPPELFG